MKVMSPRLRYAENAASDKEAVHQKKYILLADDDPGITDAVGIMLGMAGYRVSTFMDGSFMEMLAAGKYPDMFLLDIWMPGGDGRDLCKMLKTREDTKEIPVMLFSASRDVEASAREAGADDFIAKPFDMDHLLGKIGRLIS